MQKINSAESIRGLACLAVVFSHLSLSFFPYLHHFDANDTAQYWFEYIIHHSPFAFWYSGTAAVYAFFVLSGFVLSYALMRKPEQISEKLKLMVVKRYPRLMIPALGSCLLIWAIFNTINIDEQHVGGWLQAYVSQDVGLIQAIYEGTIGSFFFAESNVNWVLWTMNLELFGSFLLFLLVYLYQLKRSLFSIASVVLLMMIYYWKGEGFFLGMLSFVLGIYIYLYGQKLNTFIAVVMLLLGLYFAGAHNNSMAYAWIYQIIGERTYEYSNFFAGLLVVYSILMNPKLSGLLDNRCFIWLGKLSFSIYLLHLLFIYLICIPVFNLLLALGVEYAISVIVAAVICIAMTLLASDLYSRYVDQLAINVSNKIANKLLGHR